MTNNYHTPIPEGAAANAQTVNDPLGELDAALSEALLAERDGHIIQEEGVDLAQQPRINFTGGGVTVTNDGGGGKTVVTIPNDHGGLGGLADDDHPQYFNEARGDARYVLRTEFPFNYLTGLKLSNNVTDAVNDIDIAVGQAMDSTNTIPLRLASAITKRLDAAWAVGTNQGGLDTGSIANTTYHVFLIRRPDTGVVDVLFSTSATSPTLPANYTQYRRIGSILRISGTIISFIQDGDTFMLASGRQDVSVVNPGTSAVTRTLSVPLGIRVCAIVGVMGYGTSAAANPQSIYLSDLSQTDVAGSTTNFKINVYSDVAGITQGGGMVEVYTNTSAQIRSRVQTSAAGTGLYINTYGWKDRRGKDG